jgi:acyl-CoA synthetase (AMP-forming)/AMP-acid ligase II
VIFYETGREPVVCTTDRFQRQVSLRAGLLISHGIAEREVIIIAQTEILESIFMFWGALAVGAIPAIFHTTTEKIPPELYFADIPKLIEHSGAAAVYTGEEFANELRPWLQCPVQIAGPVDAAEAIQIPECRFDPDEIAFLQYSSGSTGVKKGITFTHRAVLNQLASYSDALEIDDQDVIVSWMPLYHDGGLIAGHLLPLVQGIPLVILSPFDWVKHPASLFKAIDRYGGTHCWMPNFAYNHSARRIRDPELEGISLASMKAFINAAEPVREASHQMFLDRFGPIGVNAGQLTVMYGMAENVLALTQTELGERVRVDYVHRLRFEQDGEAVSVQKEDPDAIGFVSCGRPLAAVEIEIVDPAFNRLPDRRVGEIIFKSDSMLSGYYRRPDLDAEVMHAGWHLSGDYGYRADGEIFVTGRKKDLIIHAGKNIYPHDLEEIVNEVPGVHPGRVVAFGFEDQREGTELIAILVETDDDREDERARLKKEIRMLLAQRTSITPSVVEIVPRGWLVKTSSGKIARESNREKWLEGRPGA